MAAQLAQAKKFVAPTLPLVTNIAKGKISILLQGYEPKYFESILGMFQDAAEKGEGYQKEEVEGEKLREKMENSTTLLCLEEKSKELLCVNILGDSPMNRSTRSMNGTTWAVVHPRARGMGIVRESYSLTHAFTLSQGYFGMLARVSLVARNIIPSLSIGCQISATIPWCTWFEKVGYVDDVVVFYDHQLHTNHPDHYQYLQDERNQPLPKLSTDNDILASLSSGVEYPTKEVRTDSGRVQLRPANNVYEVLEAEKIWRSLAEEGKGFAIDEFNEHGHLNRKFFRSSDVVVVEDAKSGDIIGASLLGPSTMSRANALLLAHQYIGMKSEKDYETIGDALVEYGMSSFKKQNYKGLISDSYVHNSHMLQVFRYNDFLFRGGFPNCGFIKGEGPLPSLVAYRKI